MATLDFTPLFRSSIGFDQLPGLLSQALQREETRLSTLRHRETRRRISTASSWRSPASAGMMWRSSRSRTD
jgi:hypothetical protein